MYDSFRLIQQADLPITYPMVLNEGGAVSRLWRHIIADVFNVPIVLAKNRAGAPFGDAILAGVATGLFKDYTMVKEWAEVVEPIEPDPKNFQRYQEYFQLYKNIYFHVKDDFQMLQGLRNGVAVRGENVELTKI